MSNLMTPSTNDPWPSCELYQAYGAARQEADLALAAWCAAPYGAKGKAFVVYRAAADREDAAAQAWLRSCEHDTVRALAA
jgi:hypothetical protein